MVGCWLWQRRIECCCYMVLAAVCVLDRMDECGVNCEESLNMVKNKEGKLMTWSEN